MLRRLRAAIRWNDIIEIPWRPKRPLHTGHRPPSTVSCPKPPTPDSLPDVRRQISDVSQKNPDIRLPPSTRYPTSDHRHLNVDLTRRKLLVVDVLGIFVLGLDPDRCRACHDGPHQLVVQVIAQIPEELHGRGKRGPAPDLLFILGRFLFGEVKDRSAFIEAIGHLAKKNLQRAKIEDIISK